MGDVPTDSSSPKIEASGNVVEGNISEDSIILDDLDI